MAAPSSHPSPGWSAVPRQAEPRATRPIEWVIAVAGGLALSAVLVWVLRGPAPDPVARPPAADTPAAAMAPMVAPMIAPLQQPASPPEAPDVGGYKLRGLIVRTDGSGSAIIESGDGRQRLVRPGGSIGGGVKVETIDATGVTLASGGSRQLLALVDGGAAPQIDTGRIDAGRIDAGSAGARPAARPGELAATSNDYRLALKPRRSGNDITGYTLTDASRLPALRLAGLKAGDVLISVNGTGIESEEKLIELPQEIAGAYAVDVVYERDGKRQRATLDIKR